MRIAPLGEGLPAGTLAIDNAEDVATLAGALANTAAVALHFPRWTDGRAYSQARLLRSRLGFAGELWAHGEVLLDMLPLLQRCGFDAAQLAPGQDAATAAELLGAFDRHYQADLVSKLPHFSAQGRGP